MLYIVLVNTVVFSFPLYAIEYSHTQGYEKLPDKDKEGINIKKNKLPIVKMLTYVIIYALMILVFYLLHNQVTETTNQFEFPSIVLYVSPIIMILFGILLNFERIIELVNAKGMITVDWLRLVIVVLPLTPISFLYLIQYTQVFQYTLMTYYIRPPVIYVAQFLLGFLLVSCFTKRRNLESSD